MYPSFYRPQYRYELKLICSRQGNSGTDIYYRPLTEGQDSLYVYNRISTIGKDSSRIEKVYDLQNRLLNQTKEKYNKELGYIEAIISRYDTLQNLISSEIKNVNNGNFVRIFLDHDKIASRLEFIESQGYKFYLGESKTPAIESIKNPMELQANYEMKDYNSFLTKNLKYPQQARDRKEMGTVILQLDVNEAGEVVKISCVNEDQLYKPLIKEAIRVIEAYNPSFIAPIDVHGNKTSSLVRVPIRFKIS